MHIKYLSRYVEQEVRYMNTELNEGRAVYGYLEAISIEMPYERQ